MKLHHNEYSVKTYMAKALISLLSKKSMADISITEIIRKAGVSRMSYYRYFQSKTDILEAYLDTIIYDYTCSIDDKKTIPFQNYTHILQSFQFFSKYKDFVLCLEKENLISILLNKLNAYVSDIYKSTYHIFNSYYSYYYSGALCNVYVQWIKNGQKESPEDMARFVLSCINKSDS